MGANVNLGYDDGKVYTNSPSINSNGDKFNIVTMEIWTKELSQSETEVRGLKIKNVDGSNEFVAIPKTFSTDTETTKGDWSKFHDFLNINETTSSETVKLLANDLKSILNDEMCLVKYDSANSIYMTPTAEDLSNAGVTSWTPPQDSVPHEFVKEDKYLLIMPVKQDNATNNLDVTMDNSNTLDIKQNIDIQPVSSPKSVQTPPIFTFTDVLGPIVVTGFQTNSVVKTCTGLNGEIISTEKREITRTPIYNGCDFPPPPEGCEDCVLIGWSQKPLPGTPGDEGLRMIRVPIWRKYYTTPE